MRLWSNEKEQFSRISLLFTISFSILLILGTLYMVFEDFNQGARLFALGVLLLSGNEFLVFSHLRTTNEYANKLRTPPQSIEDLVNFTMVACVIPSLSALFMYFYAAMDVQVLIIVFAGLMLASIKLVSCSLQFYFTK